MTQSNNHLGARVFLSYFVEGSNRGKFFRYYDAKNETIVTEPEQKGITIRKFSTSKDEPFWHCVGSYTNRVSIGYMEKKNRFSYL